VMGQRRTRVNALCTASLAMWALLAGCSKAEPSSERSNATPPAPPTHPVTQAARDTFKTRCAPCHGEAGRADGPAIAKLFTKPPNFGDAAWQKGTTDEEIRKAIVEGGPAVG
jgi:cytochrome c553